MNKQEDREKRKRGKRNTEKKKKKEKEKKKKDKAKDNWPPRSPSLSFLDLYTWPHTWHPQRPQRSCSHRLYSSSAEQGQSPPRTSSQTTGHATAQRSTQIQTERHLNPVRTQARVGAQVRVVWCRMRRLERACWSVWKMMRASCWCCRWCWRCSQRYPRVCVPFFFFFSSSVVLSISTTSSLLPSQLLSLSLSSQLLSTSTAAAAVTWRGR